MTLLFCTHTHTQERTRSSTSYACGTWRCRSRWRPGWWSPQWWPRWWCLWSPPSPAAWFLRETHDTRSHLRWLVWEKKRESRNEQPSKNGKKICIENIPFAMVTKYGISHTCDWSLRPTPRINQGRDALTGQNEPGAVLLNLNSYRRLRHF